MSLILSREPLTLTNANLDLIRSGWGDAAVDKVAVEKMVYSSDGREVEGYIASPKDTSQKYPLVIWNRGGNHKAGLIDHFLAQGMFGEIAGWGYVVLASQYRKDEQFGGDDVNDILNLLPLAEELPQSDTSRIGMEGWSRGGMMAWRALAMTDRISCAIIISGIADLNRSEKMKNDMKVIFPILFGSDDEAEFQRRKDERSAVKFYDKINKDTKLLLIHGTGDTKVSHEDSVDMHRLLSEAGYDITLKLIEGGDHYLKKHRDETDKLRKEFFAKHLQQ